MKLLTAVGIALLLSGLSAVAWTYELNPSDFTFNVFVPLVLLMVLGTVILSIVSFALARIPLQRVHARVMAILFLIVAFSVPATFYYAQETSLVGCLCSGTGGPSLVTTGSISVPTGAGNGTLSVQVRNNGPDDASITALDLTNQGLTNTTTIPNVSSIALLYQGEPVSTTNPLPFGATAAGSLQISNATAGITYEMTVHGTFVNDGSSTEAFSISAQA
jgi:hypothetical protein